MLKQWWQKRQNNSKCEQIDHQRNKHNQQHSIGLKILWLFVGSSASIVLMLLYYFLLINRQLLVIKTGHIVITASDSGTQKKTASSQSERNNQMKVPQLSVVVVVLILWSRHNVAVNYIQAQYLVSIINICAINSEDLREEETIVTDVKHQIHAPVRHA